MNEELADIGPYAQILFIGLWQLADKEGKLEDRPRRIKASIFPYYDPKPSIETLLNHLSEHDFIIRYKVGKLKLIIISNFIKHQSPHHTEKNSILPDPCDSPSSNRELTVNSPLLDGEYPPDSLNPDSLIPDSLNPDSLNRSSDDVESEKKSNGFETFWVAYPRKIAKPAALKAWKSAIKSKTFPGIEKVVAAINQQKTWQQWSTNNGKYIPYATTWINQERWNDEPAEVSSFSERTYSNLKNAWEFANE
jgi:hypothetical protein